MNRDSQLNRVGVAQIKHTRELLLAAGVFRRKPLVVVSPMRRTIETLVGLLGAEQACCSFNWQCREVQPIHLVAPGLAVGFPDSGTPVGGGDQHWESNESPGLCQKACGYYPAGVSLEFDYSCSPSSHFYVDRAIAARHHQSCALSSHPNALRVLTFRR